MSAESAQVLSSFVDRPNSPVDLIVRERILRGRDIGAERYNELLNERRGAQAALIDTFRSIDAFVMPGSHTLPVALSTVDEEQPPNRFGRLVNYLDLASLALPVGRSASGLPCGLQIVVPKFADALALRIGRALERHRQGLFTPPAGY
jgi:Asp-tRNA(Asn)/Glu-tRNA(Gln) amidotransferase A subunit family amidase